MKLLIDIGNTRLKWAVEQPGQGIVGAALLHRSQDFAKALSRVWSELATPHQIAIACVAEEQTLAIVLEQIQRFWPDLAPLRVKACASFGGLINAYAQPEKLGVDRWLAMLAAYRLYGGNLYVVDCGSALTADAIDSQGRHQGGLIAPGLSMSQQALLAGTAALQITGQRPALALATNTGAAIANGTLFMAVGLIETLVSRLASGGRVILTGGDAALVASALHCQRIVDNDLVLKGLAIVCDERSVA